MGHLWHTLMLSCLHSAVEYPRIVVYQPPPPTPNSPFLLLSPSNLQGLVPPPDPYWKVQFLAGAASSTTKLRLRHRFIGFHRVMKGRLWDKFWKLSPELTAAPGDKSVRVLSWFLVRFPQTWGKQRGQKTVYLFLMCKEIEGKPLALKSKAKGPNE